MTFRAKLLALILLSVSISVALVGWLVAVTAHKAFTQLDNERNTAFIAQFQRELQRRNDDTQRQIDAIIASEEALRMGLESTRNSPDYSSFVNVAQEQAANHQLELLEFIAPDGTIISSAQWPARFGYKEMWVLDQASPRARTAFLKNEELPESSTLSLIAVGTLRVRESNLYVVGGHQLDDDFLKTLALPAGMSVQLYRFASPTFDAKDFIGETGPPARSAKIASVVQRVQKAQSDRQPLEFDEEIEWSSDAADAETIHTVPLLGRQHELQGVLLIASSHRARAEMARHIRTVTLLVGGSVIILGFVLGTFIAGRVTKPIEQLAAAADHVAQGRWDTLVKVDSQDEVGRLAVAFNRMTSELLSQREKLIQTERVAAWRELARRLAHELKNPLFPIQITVENLLRARQHSPQEFEEVFKESTTTLLAEIANLNAIIGRFSDFSKMPAPQMQPVQMNEIVKGVGSLFSAQVSRAGGPQVKAEFQLAENLPTVSADPVLMRRAVENLVLNALDAMPNGGTLRFHTAHSERGVLFELADTGAGLTPEECERLFTPYYTTKQFGTGLGLAIVQSVISDHHGRIWVTSKIDQGTTFHIELPLLVAESATAPPDSDGTIPAKAE